MDTLKNHCQQIPYKNLQEKPQLKSIARANTRAPPSFQKNLLRYIGSSDYSCVFNPIYTIPPILSSMCAHLSWPPQHRPSPRGSCSWAVPVSVGVTPTGSGPKASTWPCRSGPACPPRSRYSATDCITATHKDKGMHKKVSAHSLVHNQQPSVNL